MNNLPTITNRTFGIEMEFEGANIRTVAETLNEVVECHFEGYTHRTTRYWKIVTDGSLPNYDTCGEIVSPVLKGIEGVQELQKVCDALDTIEGIKVTRNCGLHIHLGVSDLTVGEIQTVYERYADYEAQIDLVMPRSRRGGSRWCDSIVPNKTRVKRAKTKARLARSADRYYKVNLVSLGRYGTVEFRQHSGTLNFTKIVNWLSFLQAFVEKSRTLTNNSSSSSANKNRPYNQIRTLLENNGLSVEYNRGYESWSVRNSDEVRVGLLGNWRLNSLYDGARENSLDRTRAIEYLWDEISEDLVEDWEFASTRQAAETQVLEEDGGWLDGVDQKVQNYFEEREDELN